ncbi:immunoglobulin superfamily member 1-like isoform X2 [Ambystoma mexicanum]
MKAGNLSQEKNASAEKTQFNIPGAEDRDEGEYTCQFKSQSTPLEWSEPSNTLDVTVREHYFEPSIRVLPNRVIKKGSKLAIHCSCRRPNMQFLLYKGNERLQQKDPEGQEATFDISGASEKDVGQYICYYCTRTDQPKVCSEISDPLIVNVTDLAKPTISWEIDADVEGGYAILCSAPEQHRGSWFSLYSEGHLIEEDKAGALAIQVRFPINQSTLEYQCMYRVEVSGALADSPLSNSVIVGNDFTLVSNIRFLLSGLVLILALLFIAEDCYSRKKEGQMASTGPAEDMTQCKDIPQTLVIHDSV